LTGSHINIATINTVIKLLISHLLRPSCADATLRPLPVLTGQNRKGRSFQLTVGNLLPPYRPRESWATFFLMARKCRTTTLSSARVGRHDRRAL
jgi:hypothetical protein